MHTNENPLISFVIIAYNQEHCIKEAIEGALSQTYSPLEIILSDDCSSDRTFEIMKELSENYKGPHKIILNKNNPNLGICGHINYVMERSSGEFIVLGAGDDISLPERIAMNVSKWSENPNTKLIYSDCYFIDQSGDVLKIHKSGPRMQVESLDNIIKKNLWCIGAACAIHKSVFQYFGPLMNELVHEDRAWPVRAKLLGDISYINIPLVKYQVFGGVSNDYMVKNDWLLNKSIKWYSNFINDYRQKILDLRLLSADEELIEICKNKINEHALNKLISNGGVTWKAVVLADVSFLFKFKVIFKVIKRKLLLLKLI